MILCFPRNVRNLRLAAAILAACAAIPGHAQGPDQGAMRETLLPGLAQTPLAVRERAFGERELIEALRVPTVESAPVNPHYIIGPGDQLVIDLWGKRSQTFNPVVDEHGFVSVNVDGATLRFAVNGIRFKDLRDKVVREFSKLTGDVDPLHPESGAILVDVTLGKIRGINLTVLGEVERPGQYTLKTTISSVFNVLAAAGGMTAEASLRQIMVRRPGGAVDGVDLYALLTSGEIDEAMFHLHDGDVVVVPPRQRTATLAGEIRRPNTYEILEGQKLKRLIEVAGGLTANADPHKVKILRTFGVEEPHFIEVSLDERDFVLHDGDRIEIVAKPEARRLNVVEVKGAGVRQPGLYGYRDDATVGTVLEEAGGLYEDAMRESAALVRTREDYTLEFRVLDLNDPQTLNEALQPLDKVIVYSAYHQAGGDKYVSVAGHVKEPGQYLLSARMTIEDLLFMAGGFGDPDFRADTWLARADLTRIDPETQEKRILPVALEKVLAGDASENLLLRSRDHLRVYALHEMRDERRVRICGEVRVPGEYDLAGDMVLSDLISLSGGLTERADRDRVEIARFPESEDAGARAAEILHVSLSDDAGSETRLRRDDVVVVRRKPQYRERGMVAVSGQVTYPGNYVLLDRSETVSDVIDRAGGFVRGADPAAARLRRRRQGLPDIPGRDGTPSVQDNAKYRDVSFDLVRAMNNPRGPYDVRLLDGDVVHVPPQNWVVRVEGAVRLPGTVQYVKGRRASYYIDTVGGFRRDADRRETLVIHPNGAAVKARRRVLGLFPVWARVRPGSAILAPFSQPAATRAEDGLRDETARRTFEADEQAAVRKPTNGVPARAAAGVPAPIRFPGVKDLRVTDGSEAGM